MRQQYLGTRPCTATAHRCRAQRSHTSAAASASITAPLRVVVSAGVARSVPQCSVEVDLLIRQGPPIRDSQGDSAAGKLNQISLFLPVSVSLAGCSIWLPLFLQRLRQGEASTSSQHASDDAQIARYADMGRPAGEEASSTGHPCQVGQSQFRGVSMPCTRHVIENKKHGHGEHDNADATPNCLALR